MEHIRIAIRDSTDSMNICFLDNYAGIKFHEATLQRFLKGTCNFLTLKFYGKDIDTIYPGCRLAFKYADNDYWLTINSFEKNGYECSLTAYSLSLETNKEKRKAYKAPSWTFKQYLDYVDPEHSLTLGLNEVASQSIQLEWSGTDTILARLFSIANSFGAELEFVTELNDDYSLKRHVLNVYKVGNIGKDKTGMPIRVGKSLKVINYTANIDELYTAIRVHGKDGLTIQGLDKKVYDSDNNLLYYTQGDTLYAPQARDRFPSIAHKASDSFICLESEDTEHSSKEALYAYMLGELKKHSEPKIDYETEGYVDGEIGDRMLLIDSVHYDPPLYVEARISEQTISLLDKSKNKTVFTNYERKKSEIANELLAKMTALIEENKTYDVQILTSNGYSFKNGFGETTLTARVMDGAKDVSGDFVINWYRDGNLIGPNASITVQASSINEKVVYRIIAYKDGVERGLSELTLINVNDGLQGPQGEQGPAGQDGIPGKDGVGLKTTVVAYGLSNSESTQPTSWSTQVPTLTKGSYLWTRTIWTYTDNTTETGYQKTYIARDGNDGNDGVPGKDGVGIESTTITYASSTSGTTKPTSGWSVTIPSVPSGQYLWTKTTWTYTDGTSETGYSVAKMGERGPQGEQGLQGDKGADGQSLYTWLKYADDANGNGMSETPDGKKYIGLAYNKTVSTESGNPNDYTWSLIQGENGVNGTDGKTYYTWVKYADTSTGGGLSDNPTGKKYIGLAYNKTTPEESVNPSDYQWALIKGEQGETGNGVSSTEVAYGVSNSGTIQPTSWQTTIPKVPNGQYLWTRTIMHYTNGTSTTFFSVAKMGETGPQGTMGIAYLQPNEPTGEIPNGSTWFKTVSTTDNRITSIYHYLSGSWVQNQFTQDAINVKSLSALSATLGNVTAGTITGSSFMTAFDRPYTSTTNRVGTLVVNDGKIRVDYRDRNTSTGQETATNSYMEYSETGIDFAENDGTATGKRLELNSNRIALGDSGGVFHADPSKMTLSGDGYFKLHPKYFLGSSGDSNYQKMSWTVDGFELRPVDINGNPRSGNTGIEIAGNNSYVDFKVPHNNAVDFNSRIILYSNQDFEVLQAVANKVLRIRNMGQGGELHLVSQYSNVNLMSGVGVNVRDPSNSSWKTISAGGFSQQSDEKWKYNIKDIPSRLEQFKNLDFKAYRLWAESGKYQEGVIANDNIELPFISKGYDGYAVDTYSYATFIGKATQEYITQTDNTINGLKNENADLKTKVDNLTTELETIKRQLSTLLNK